MFTLYKITTIGYWLSSSISYILVSIISFFLNKYFTFGVRGRTAFRGTVFAVNIAVAYLLAYGIAKPAVNNLLKTSPQKTRENLALFAGMCLFTGLNYIGQRFIVFRKKRSD
jgi:putative flippase GtrA